MKISVLAGDISGNGFGRAWVLAKALKKRFQVEIIAPESGDGIWKPLRDSCDFEVRSVKGWGKGRFELRRMLSIISGDVIYSSKPLLASFGTGIMKKFSSGKPLVIDIDDWESGFGKEFYDSLPFFKKINDARLSLGNFNSRYYSSMLEKFVWLADDVTVSGNALRKKYGGTVIWHARDADFFRPGAFDRLGLRSRYLGEGERERFVVGFLGTPRPHKGLEDLVSAMGALRGKNVMLLIIGANEDPYTAGLRGIIEERGLTSDIRLLPEQPFSKIPEFLSLMDLVVIPQTARAAASAQVPAKLFDAMAMAKPIVSTSVSDIPEILSGCGWVTEPGSPEKLAEAICYAKDNPSEAAAKGLAARNKFEREYSLDAVSSRLAGVFEKYEKRERAR